MTSLLKTALSYAARGWRVFPVHGIESSSVGPRASAATSDEETP